MHRTNNPRTAQILTSRLNKVEIEKVGSVHGYTDSSNPNTEEDFSSSSMQREDEYETMLVEDGHVQSLPTGEAFMLVNGSKLYKVKVPLVTVDTRHAPDNIKEMLGVLAEQERLYGHQQINWEDDWFKVNYPEYANPGSAEAPQSVPATNKKQQEPDGYIPNSDVNTAMLEEAGSAAAEFSAMSGNT